MGTDNAGRHRRGTVNAGVHAKQRADSAESMSWMLEQCRRRAGLDAGTDVAPIEDPFGKQILAKQKHSVYVCATALWLFDQLQERHGLREPRWRYLLWAGALLHDIGYRFTKVSLPHTWAGADYVLRNKIQLAAGNLEAGEIAALVALHGKEDGKSCDVAVRVGDKYADILGQLYKPVYERLGGRLPVEILQFTAILRVADGLQHVATEATNPFGPQSHRLEGDKLWVALKNRNNKTAREKEGLMRALFKVGVVDAA